MSENLVALFTLTWLEIVLGIDNIVFIAIVVSRLPSKQQNRARKFGIIAALITRLLLLCTLTWMMKLTKPLFTMPLLYVPISGKSLILFFGGLFLIAKSTFEIHNKLEGSHDTANVKAPSSIIWAVLQIAIIDIVFSLDSVITAVGMARELWIMITAVILAVLVMLVSAKTVCDFVDRHPTIKILALSFLLLIGMLLMVEGLGKHIERGYIYFAMGFSLFVELLNMRVRSKAEPVRLHKPPLSENI